MCLRIREDEKFGKVSGFCLSWDFVNPGLDLIKAAVSAHQVCGGGNAERSNIQLVTAQSAVITEATSVPARLILRQVNKQHWDHTAFRTNIPKVFFNV